MPAALTNVPRTFVSVDGIGPSTSVLSGQRSTTELHAQWENYNKYIPIEQTNLPASKFIPKTVFLDYNQTVMTPETPKFNPQVPKSIETHETSPVVKVVRVIAFQSISENEIPENTDLANLYFTKSIWIRKGADAKNPNQIMPIGGKADEGEEDIETADRELLEETHLVPKYGAGKELKSVQNYSFTSNGKVQEREAHFTTTELLPGTYDIPYPMDNAEDKIGGFIPLDVGEVTAFFKENKTKIGDEELPILDSLEQEQSIKKEILEAQKVVEMNKKKKVISTLAKRKFNRKDVSEILKEVEEMKDFDQVQEYWKEFVENNSFDLATIQKSLKETNDVEYIEDLGKKFNEENKTLVPTINLIFPLLFNEGFGGKELIHLIKGNPQLEKLYKLSRLLSLFNLYNQGDKKAKKRLEKTIESENIDEEVLKTYLQKEKLIGDKFTHYFTELATEVDELFRQLNKDLNMRLSGFQVDQKNEVQSRNLEETLELAFSKDIGKIKRFEAQRRLVLVYMLYDIKSYLLSVLNTGIGKMDKLEGSLEIKNEGSPDTTSGVRKLKLDNNFYEVKIEKRTKVLRSLLRKAIVRDNFNLNSFNDIFAESITFVNTSDFMDKENEFKLPFVENEIPCLKISDAKGKQITPENIANHRMPQVVFDYIKGLYDNVTPGDHMEIVEWKGLPLEGEAFQSNSAGGGSKIRLCKFYINLYTKDNNKSSREVQIFLPRVIKDPNTGESKVVGGLYDNEYKKVDDDKYASNRLFHKGIHRSMIELLFPVAIYGEEVKTIFKKDSTNTK